MRRVWPAIVVLLVASLAWTQGDGSLMCDLEELDLEVAAATVAGKIRTLRLGPQPTQADIASSA
jgi:hypothetical protein